MTKHTAPAVNEGLPNSDPKSGIADSPKGGLMVIRQFADGATPLGLPAEELSELLALLDAHQSFESGVSNSISHAIVRDLLASDCWRAPTHHSKPAPNAFDKPGEKRA
jgi:hypothetical protein